MKHIKSYLSSKQWYENELKKLSNMNSIYCPSPILVIELLIKIFSFEKTCLIAFIIRIWYQCQKANTKEHIPKKKEWSTWI